MKDPLGFERGKMTFNNIATRNNTNIPIKLKAPQYNLKRVFLLINIYRTRIFNMNTCINFPTTT